MPTLFLDRHAAKALIRMADVINVVEEAFRMCGEGRGRMPTKTYLSLEHADFRPMPAALPECAGGNDGRRTGGRPISWCTFDAESGGNL